MLSSLGRGGLENALGNLEITEVYTAVSVECGAGKLDC